jgi:hypothetical protein
MSTHSRERLVIVVADVVRCSSTLLTAFGAGLQSATIGVKSGGGTSRQQAERIGAALGADVVIGGELDGHPNRTMGRDWPVKSASRRSRALVGSR